MDQTLEALRASEERFRQIVEIANEGIWTIDAQGFTTFINPRLQQILGYSLEEMQGKPGIDFVYEEDRERVRAYLRRRREGLVDTYEVQLLHKDGTPVWVQVASSPLRDKQGEYAGSLKLLTDISLRKRTEEELWATQARLRLAVDVAGLSIIHVDYRTSTAFLSPEAAAIFELPADEDGIPRAMLHARFHADDRNELEWRIAQSHDPSGDGWFAMEHRIVRLDGSVRWLSIRKQIFFDSDSGHPDTALVVAIDITERQQSGEALAESEMRFRNAFESAPIGMAWVSLEGKCVSANPALCQMLGYSHSEMMALTFQGLTHPEDLQNDIAHRGRLIRGEIPYHHGMKRVYDKEGRIISCRISASVVRDSAGHPLYLIVQIQDLTEQIQSASSLRESEEKYRQIVETADEGIWTIDAQGFTTFINPRLQQILGYSLEEIRAKSAIDFIHEEDWENVRAGMQRRRDGFADSYEVRFLHKDGTTVWIQVSTSPLHDKHGLYAGTLGLLTDISARKQAEEVLRHSEERFRTTLENLMEGCLIVDHDLRHLYVNATLTKHARRSAQQLLGHTLPEVYPGIENTAMYAALRRCLVEQTPRQMEAEFFHDDGTSTWFQVVIQPVPEGLFILSLDINERKNTEEAIQRMTTVLEQRVAERTAALEAANKELEAFSYSVSHDLRAPLRAVDGFSRIVVEEYGKQLPAEAQEYLKDVRANAKQMGMLIDDLLAFSRLSRQAMKPQNVDMTALAHFCFKELNRGNGARQVDFRIHDLPPCAGDPALLKQVWLNLISNALKYSANRDLAIIEVGSNASTEGTTYFVRDNGVGFNMKYAHKLFGVFQRLHRAEEYEGTGVGLAIVQRIVHRHGGTVHAESIVDTGATFFFTIPEIADTIDGRHN